MSSTVYGKAFSRKSANLCTLWGMEIEDHIRKRVKDLMGDESVNALAKRAGVGTSTLNEWLNKDTRSTSLDTLIKVSKALGVDAWKLFPDAVALTDEEKAIIRDWRKADPAQQDVARARLRGRKTAAQ